MPELPEVERVVRSLRQAVCGRTIRSTSISETVRLSKADGKEAVIKKRSVANFVESMNGMEIRSIERRAKYIYFHLEKGGEPYLLVSHLGMSGAWFHLPPGGAIEEDKFARHVHAEFALDDGSSLAFSDMRRFGELRLLKEEGDHPPLLAMAPDPFSPEALPHFLAACERPSTASKAIKEVIMDGRCVAGCGNIYATEALFSMKIRPDRAARRISRARKIQLFEAICTVLAESIEAGGSTISDYRNVNGEAGGMQHRLKMYGRLACPLCGSAVQRRVIGGRTSSFCPKCQL